MNTSITSYESSLPKVQDYPTSLLNWCWLDCSTNSSRKVFGIPPLAEVCELYLLCRGFENFIDPLDVVWELDLAAEG